jgi:5-methyltetrahydrofolate--homocysteine methyltransferase
MLHPEKKKAFDAENRTSQERLRFVYEQRQQRPLLTLGEARANPLVALPSPENCPTPSFTGRRVVDDVSVADLEPFIDWTFFFSAWELKGKFPRILDHPKLGPAARDLYQNARAMLTRIIDEELLTPRGVYGFWPAASDGDDIVLFHDDTRNAEIMRFNMLRQQGIQPNAAPNRCLSDYLAPVGCPQPDTLGAFAVTSGLEAEDLATGFEKDLDDYSAIMVKALADRLAEAFAELLHARARRDWGYGASENLASNELLAEKYRGIRPAFGYPACPDHSEKRKLFELLGAPEIGIELTESCAMRPGASVSGIYFANPSARYFSVGRIDRDQALEYAGRTGRTLEEVERWLAPNLGYDPDA